MSLARAFLLLARKALAMGLGPRHSVIMTRIDRLQTRMAETETDLVVLAPGAHMAWLMEVHPHADERAVLACISRTGAALLMPVLEALLGAEGMTADDIQLITEAQLAQLTALG